MEESAETAPDELVLDELVDDRALTRFEFDEFGHYDFVQELAGVISHARTPANIALFGPWGSGKTSISNMLRDALPKDRRAVRFVTFDASKYAEAPLRRHFISQVAAGLDVNDSKFHEDLYRDREDRDINFRLKRWLSAVLWALAAAIAVAALVAAVAVIVALCMDGATAANLEKTTDWVLKAGAVTYVVLPVAALLTAGVKVVIDGITVVTRHTAPSGDEEFEARFRDLVGAAGTSRLVVFIDELDRCSPEQVASTLETLKTFLFVRGCIFVVGADQQVLEQALRRKARQHTPEDTTNPYYSAGSSYLDKVFQYQLTLPPLQAPVLGRFALQLVARRPGVWQRIHNLDEAVSVLVPTHVTSPRRVKVLLNRFAIAYRLAERRVAESRLDPGFPRRASELAKLVCLQCEFPLFANDLTLESRLPDLVRRIADEEALPREVRPDIRLRAEAYAAGRLSVAEYLVDGHSDSALENILSKALARLSVLPENATVDDEIEGEVAEEVSDNDVSTSAVARRHAQQLISYLRKTRHVQGPGADLVYLESAGALHGIDPVHADQLQRAALDNDRREVLRLVAQAAEERQGRGALLVLADVVRQDEPGVGGRNVVNALMESIELGRVELDPAAAEYIADAVAGHMTRTRLGGEDLVGALKLAAASRRDVGQRLRAAVLRHDDSVSRSDVATELLAHAEAIPPNLRRRMAEATATALLENPKPAAQQLRNVPIADGKRLLEAAGPVLYRRAREAYRVLRGEEEAEDSGDGTSQPGTEPHVALTMALDELLESRPLASALAAEMLDVREPELRESVVTRIEALGPVNDYSLCQAMIGAAHHVPFSEVAVWLAPLDLDLIGTDQGLQEYFDSLGCALWERAADNEGEHDHLNEALAAMSRIAPVVRFRTDLDERVRSRLDVPFSNDSLIDEQKLTRRVAALFSDAGVLDFATVADCDIAAVTRTVEAGVSEDLSPSPVRNHVDHELLVRARQAAPHASTTTLEAALEAAAGATWLPAVMRTHLRLHLARALRDGGQAVETPIQTEELASLASDARDDPIADQALACWLDGFADDTDVAWDILRPMTADGLPREAEEALGRFVRRLDAGKHLRFVDRVLFTDVLEEIDPSFFRPLHLSELNAQEFAERLTRLYRRANTIKARRAVMELWSLFNPTSPSVRRRLVDDIYIPLIATGVGGFDIAVTHFGLVHSVDNVRRRVRDALRGAAATDRDERRLENKFAEAGWTARRRFRPPKDL